MPDFQSANVNLENTSNSKTAKDSKSQSLSAQMKRNNLDGILQRARSNPGSLTPNDIIQLQSTIGNKAVCQLFSGREDKSLLMAPVQASDDMPEEEEEKTLQAAIEPVQMEDGLPEEEEEPIQGKGLRSGGMPEEVQAKMEGAFKTDFSDVKIHADSGKATEVGALAYTQGSDIHFAPGQYHPSDQPGQALLGHELTHVVQQREGRVQPTTQMAGLPVNDDEGLESEADSLGASAASFKLS